ncbi:E3 ubiquitin-protein ligase rnf168-like [Macrobrachium nipponense]|uniref:E3 ubiquitin-protein ligase rnf168-like n=1 Tax=Macrobrachium nipponense TaxID=159736 RepID=UPI0030C83E29
MSARKKLDLKLSQLTLEDVICPICLSILVEPVTMPCSHSLCMPCFKQHVAETSLACPVCRTRISVWVRRNNKSNRLINNRLWQVIKEKFPEKIEARLQGKDDLDDEEFFVREPRVCAPGEIRQEFEALIQQEQQELASRRSQEEEASTRLILKLQEEETMKLRQRRAQEEQLCQEDEVLALQIKEAENQVLEKRIQDIQLMCGNDEELARQIARQIEEEEKAKAKPSTKLAANKNLLKGQWTCTLVRRLQVPKVNCCYQI